MTDVGAVQLFVGNHLWHVLMLAAWVPLFSVIALTQRRHRLHAPTTSETARRSPVRNGTARTGLGAVVPWCQWMALASVCAALVHVAVMPDHFAQSAWYGSFFLLAAIGQVAFAVAVVTRPSRALVAAGVTACALVIALWMVSRFIGVPIGPDHGATEPIGVLDSLASVAEACVGVLGVLALRSRIVFPTWRWSAWSPPMRLAAPICLTGTVVASLLAARS